VTGQADTAGVSGRRRRSDDILRSPEFRSTLAQLARSLGQDPAAVEAEARGYARELRTQQKPLLMAIFLRAGRALCGAGYGAIDYDREQVERLRDLFARYPVAVLSSHRSYLDGGAITIGFADHGLPRLTGFSGINMAFWPLGPIWRRAGVIFIRRGGTSPVYRLVLREYLGSLVERRTHLTWFIEGTRSRTGKLAPPRLGLLFNVVEAYLQGRTEDLVLLPVSVSYDQLQEVEEFAGEARGARKQAEGVGWLIRFARSQRGRYGTIYVRFGEPVSLRESLGPPAALTVDSPDLKAQVQKLAFEVSWRINRATPITGASLVTLALLGARGVALTIAQIRVALAGYLIHARRRGLPLASSATLDDEAGITSVLQALQSYDVVSAYTGGRQAVYTIGADEHLAAAYYRNSIIHFFLDNAIVELAWLGACDAPPAAREQAFWTEALALRDLLKFEFFFRDKQEYQAALEEEASLLDPAWRQRLGEGTDGVRAMLERIDTLSSDMILRSFIEAYAVLADVLLERGAAACAEAGLAERCMGLGRQYLLQERLRSPESVSRHLFQTGIQLAVNRNLCVADRGVEDRRRRFADELWRVVRHMNVVHDFAVRRVEQLVEAERR
jgi:glycerol-3-phosphate O-acyltransferase